MENRVFKGFVRMQIMLIIISDKIPSNANFGNIDAKNTPLKTIKKTIKKSLIENVFLNLGKH